MTPAEPVFLHGERIKMSPLGPSDISESYLAWLNDPDVLRYRAPKAFPTTMPQLESWVRALPDRGDLVLSIRTNDENRHVGNISLNSILWVHRTAELAIMIGAKDVWGQGYGTEAIRLITAHAFTAMGLHRLWAESPNPAFNAAMQKLGWNHEGSKREAFLVDGAHVDFECWRLLEQEWWSKSGAQSRS